MQVRIIKSGGQIYIFSHSNVNFFGVQFSWNRL